MKYATRIDLTSIYRYLQHTASTKNMGGGNPRQNRSPNDRFKCGPFWLLDKYGQVYLHFASDIFHAMQEKSIMQQHQHESSLGQGQKSTISKKRKLAPVTDFLSTESDANTGATTDSYPWTSLLAKLDPSFGSVVRTTNCCTEPLMALFQEIEI
jgi:hypothetical protein